MKRIISLILTLTMLMSVVCIKMTANASATPQSRYTVLVLDTSNEASFLKDGVTFYTAKTAIEYVKRASVTFLENIERASGNNYVAVVEFKDTANTVSDFSKDYSYLKGKINSLSSSSNTRDISAGLSKASQLLSNVGDGNATKNIVLFSTGMTNAGNYSYSGHYGTTTVGSNWKRTNTGVKLYAYANNAYKIASNIKDSGTNIYSIGLFQTYADMPSQGKEIADFFRLTAKDLANSEEYFYDVENPDDLEFVFDNIATVINYEDSDGDGLYDIWETSGIDTDGDGTIDVHLEKMGADPNKKDIFVEVDWMVQPEENFLWIQTKERIKLAPSDDAMRLVYEAFKKKGINLHVDAGPDSTDFVTGKKWGALSGGNEIPYEENFELGGNYEHWNDVVEKNFSDKKSVAFKHCLFINRYDGGTSSGIAAGIPGQCFIVANQKWVRNTGNTGVAGTFMHELGHTLGLSHGGFDDYGNNNHEHYKPNYLSIMNYLFQTSGLVGTNSIDYSRYDLPDLNENKLNEKRGIDPDGLTAGTGLGTKIRGAGWLGTDKVIKPIAREWVDLNGWWGFQDGTVDADLNGDGKKTVLTSSTDWDHIIFDAGNIGYRKQTVVIAGISLADTLNSEQPAELSLEEALSHSVVSEIGTGAIEAQGPFTYPCGVYKANVYLKISNMSASNVTFKLNIKKSALTKAVVKTVTIPASTDKINYVSVPVEVDCENDAGDYKIKATLSYNNNETAKADIPLTLKELSPDEIAEAYNQLNNNSNQFDSEEAYKEYISVLPGAVDGAKKWKENKRRVNTKKVTTTYSKKKGTLKVKWKKVNNTKSYKIRYRKYGSKSWKTKSLKNVTSYTIKNVAKNSCYEIQIKANVNDGKKPKYSDSVYRYTNTATLNNLKKKGTKITASWKKSKKANKYELQLATDSKFKNNVQTKTVKNSKTSSSFSNLKKKKTYYVRVRVIRKAGKNKYIGEWSSAKKIKL